MSPCCPISFVRHQNNKSQQKIKARIEANNSYWKDSFEHNHQKKIQMKIICFYTCTYKKVGVTGKFPDMMKIICFYTCTYKKIGVTGKFPDMTFIVTCYNNAWLRNVCKSLREFHLGHLNFMKNGGGRGVVDIQIIIKHL